MNKPLITAIRPWTAGGPGWANAGITVAWEDMSGKRGTYTIQREDFTPEIHELFGVVLPGYHQLEARVAQALKGKYRRIY